MSTEHVSVLAGTTVLSDRIERSNVVTRCANMNRLNRSEAIAALFPVIQHDSAGVWASYVPHAEHEGQPGWVQGGFVATVLDYVCAYLATETFGSQAITGNLTVRYGAPVIIEDGPYQVLARLSNKADGPNRRTLRIEGSVVNLEDETVVTASGLFVRRTLAS